MYIYMSCLICCCACALICFTVGEWETFFSIPLYVLTCKVIDNKALTLILSTGEPWEYEGVTAPVHQIMQMFSMTN